MGEPAGSSEPDRPSEPAGSVDRSPERPGPQPLPDDTWDASTGRHRLVGRRRVPRRYLAAALIVASVAVGAGVGLPLLGSGASNRNPLADGPSSMTGGSPTSPAASATTTIAVVVT